MIETKYEEGKLWLFEDGIKLPFRVKTIGIFPVDLTDYEIKKEIMRKKENIDFKKREYRHKSRGIAIRKFQEKLIELIEDCVDKDYIGDDEWPIDVIDKSKLVRKITQFLPSKIILLYT